ncbi:hypothetical protein DVU_1416 [Nitratidesulfovibrio vulgaris str. Hildenborough]|uniref:Uncharacterized protein n=1 Tax=Nitratidesulfovibrio vulgaris (strain ATCC 29579 / DSM 644 / CCUG 34227 / NCIMB 8303 / VKM B-1760 / Hildenborough) TaxID=882 RepID=Q72C68_NITV2|nr:hypothetical protein DVU_1416 [Nitratidesulfovibrio vulgaris str. Hildenborough]
MVPVMRLPSASASKEENSHPLASPANVPRKDTGPKASGSAVSPGSKPNRDRRSRRRAWRATNVPAHCSEEPPRSLTRACPVTDAPATSPFRSENVKERCAVSAERFPFRSSFDVAAFAVSPDGNRMDNMAGTSEQDSGNPVEVENARGPSKVREPSQPPGAAHDACHAPDHHNREGKAAPACNPAPWAREETRRSCSGSISVCPLRRASIRPSLIVASREPDMEASTDASGPPFAVSFISASSSPVSTSRPARMDAGFATRTRRSVASRAYPTGRMSSKARMAPPYASGASKSSAVPDAEGEHLKSRRPTSKPRTLAASVWMRMS